MNKEYNIDKIYLVQLAPSKLGEAMGIKKLDTNHVISHFAKIIKTENGIAFRLLIKKMTLTTDYDAQANFYISNFTPFSLYHHEPTIAYKTMRDLEDKQRKTVDDIINFGD